MKKIMFLLIACFLFVGTTVSALEQSTASKYTVTYSTGCDMNITGTTVVSRTEAAEVVLSRVTPRKEGYTFLGWSESEQDYVNDPLYRPSQRIEITSSVKLYAIWQNDEEKILKYEDDVLPAQIVDGETVKISALIPKKPGHKFCGWTVEKGDEAEVFLPGNSLTVSGDTMLVPLWESGSLPEIMPEVSHTEQGVLFECPGIEVYDEYLLKISNMITGEESTYLGVGEDILVDDLNPGQYKAHIEAISHGITYKSKRINVVVKDENPNPQNPLVVYMNGEVLDFDMPPVLLDNYTFVTLRYFSEYVGADVYWDEQNATAVVTYNGTRIKIKENSDVCVVNGATFNLPAPTRIMSSRMFIPLRSVAEFLNCEIVWDESQKVYVFTDSANIFDNNLFFVSGVDGKYFTWTGENVLNQSMPDYGSAWVFDTVDEELGIYEIYNLTELYNPLEVRMSRIKDGQRVRMWEKRGYDGCLWKVSENEDGTYFISPANNENLFLDVANMCITSQETKSYLKCVGRL